MDIVERLRKAQQTFYGDTSINELHMYASAEIERLRKEIELLHIKIDYYMKVLAFRDDIHQKDSE